MKDRDMPIIVVPCVGLEVELELEEDDRTLSSDS
jgi:hypothetical protein